MRRSEREITSRVEIDAILQRASVLYLGVQDEGAPYVVPLHFGYDGTALFIHSALEGRKIELLRRHPRVSFTVTLDEAAVPGEVGCAWSARYRCVMGVGEARFLTERAEQLHALDSLLGKFAAGPFAYREDVLARTAVIAITIRELSGKQAGYERW
jgi:nitroimidazol reductase NimA-like FMN-containing flavoprotein (pyridoxamine 5'-phosphate oxidase superfamily)